MPAPAERVVIYILLYLVFVSAIGIAVSYYSSVFTIITISFLMVLPALVSAVLYLEIGAGLILLILFAIAYSGGVGLGLFVRSRSEAVDSQQVAPDGSEDAGKDQVIRDGLVPNGDPKT
jgi:hypothetical protein